MSDYSYGAAGLIAGVLDDDFDVAGEDIGQGIEEIDEWLGAQVRKPPRAMLSSLASAKIRDRSKMASAVGKLKNIAKQTLLQSGRIEAEYLRRPNTLVSLYTPVIAPGATSAFSVQPGVGTSYYRLLGFIVSDEMANVFGFTSLKIGGQEHVQMSQSSPSAPVSNAVPWAIFALREPSLKTNLAPWSGQIFDQSTPVIGTVANMTVAASGDALTVAARGVFLCQTDPCGRNYTQIKAASNRFWGSLRNNVGAYAPLIAA